MAGRRPPRAVLVLLAIVLASLGAARGAPGGRAAQPGGTSASGVDHVPGAPPVEETEEPEIYADIPATDEELAALELAAVGADVPASDLAFGQQPPPAVQGALRAAHNASEFFTLPQEVAAVLARLSGACGQVLSGAAAAKRGVKGYKVLQTLIIDDTTIAGLRSSDDPETRAAARLIECVSGVLAGAFGATHLHPIHMRVWSDDQGTTTHKDRGECPARLCCRLRHDTASNQPSAHGAGTIKIWLANARHTIALMPGDVFVLGRAANTGTAGHLGTRASHRAEVDEVAGTEVVTLVMDLPRGTAFPPAAGAFNGIPEELEKCFEDAGELRSRQRQRFTWPAAHPAPSVTWTTHPPDSAGRASADAKRDVLGDAYLLKKGTRRPPAEPGSDDRPFVNATGATIPKEDVIQQAKAQAKEAATKGGLASRTTGTHSVGEEGLKLQADREAKVAEKRVAGKRAPPNTWLDATGGDGNAARGASNLESQRNRRAGKASKTEHLSPEQASCLERAIRAVAGNAAGNGSLASNATACREKWRGRQEVVAQMDANCKARNVPLWKPDEQDRTTSKSSSYRSIEGYIRRAAEGEWSPPPSGTCAAEANAPPLGGRRPDGGDGAGGMGGGGGGGMGGVGGLCA